MPVTGWEVIAATITIAVTVLFTDAFWFEKFFIKTNTFYPGGAKKTSANIKVVQISDLHLQSINYSLRRLTKRLNKMQPDLIMITGDAIDKAANISLLDEFLELIDKKIQKVAILGNWEYQSKANLAALESVYTKNNCNLLINQTVRYSFRGTTVSITGVDDFLRGAPDIHTAIRGYVASDHHLILTHCPKYSDEISKHIPKEITVDFILAGHTHGGQITFFGQVRYVPKGSGRYVKGWYNDRSPELYVSKGIGTVFFPARFGARAEIAVFNLTAGEHREVILQKTPE